MEPRHVPGRAKTVKLSSTVFTHFKVSWRSGGKQVKGGKSEVYDASASRAEKKLSLEATWH